MIKMTNKDAIKIIQMERDHCALHNQDAGKDEEYHKEMQSLVDAFDLAIKALEDKPQGEWIGNAFDEHHCNRCEHPALWEEEPDGYYEVQSRFCPNCGADMRGEEE